MSSQRCRRWAISGINGVKIHENEAVRSWEIDGEGVRVTTADETYTAELGAIITAGAWAAKMLGELGLPLEVRRKVLFWLNVEDESLFQPERMPVYISDSSLGEIYGFPVFDQPGLNRPAWVALLLIRSPRPGSAAG